MAMSMSLGSYGGYGSGSGNYGSVPTVNGSAFFSSQPAITQATSSSGSNSLLNSITSAGQNLLGSAATAVGASLPYWLGAAASAPPTNPVNPTAAAGSAHPSAAAYGVPGTFTIGGATIPYIDIGIGVAALFAIYLLVKKGK